MAVLRCPAGHEWSDNGGCTECRPGYYRSNPVYEGYPGETKCHLKYECTAVGLVTVNEGSTTEDRSCGCDIQQGYYLKDSKQTCNSYSDNCHCYRQICDPGQGLKLQLDKTNNEMFPVCELCPNGTYSPADGYGPCRNCPEVQVANQHPFCQEINQINTTSRPINYTRLHNDTSGFAVPEGGSNTWIIGLGVGGFVCIAAAILVFYFCYWRKKNKKHKSEKYKPVCATPSTSSSEDSLTEYSDERLNRCVTSSMEVFIANHIVRRPTAYDFAKKVGLDDDVIRQNEDNAKNLIWEALTHCRSQGSNRVGDLEKCLKAVKHGRLADDIVNGRLEDYEPTEAEEKREKTLYEARNKVKDVALRDWKKLARELGLGKSEIDDISYRHKDELEFQFIEALDLWKQKYPRNEYTVEKLICCLRSAQLNEAADEVEKLLTEASSETSV